MTAYWTESLNKQFKLNNDNNKDLDWQYFCSSSGLYRQYPGAYWTVPARQDFFDCRLQSWYVINESKTNSNQLESNGGGIFMVKVR
jgi:hypothetical protein